MEPRCDTLTDKAPARRRGQGGRGIGCNVDCGMSRQPDQPDAGWAVRLTPEESDRRRARADRWQRLATAKHLFLLVLGLWNLLGLTYLIGSLQYINSTGSVVLTAVIWIWVVGNIAIVGSDMLIRRVRSGVHSPT
jgi:hypothetical protein